MHVIGLTGGIASGKSLVSGELRKLGAEVIDADQIAREVVQPGKPAWMQIVREFGDSFLDSSGHIDRKALGRLVFSDPRELEKLNRITHPPILAEIARLLQCRIPASGGVVVIDAPLLFETGLDKLVDEIWVVDADFPTQLRRLMERDRLSEHEARRRIALQMPLPEKVRSADRILKNTGTPEMTVRQVREAWTAVQADYPG